MKGFESGRIKLIKRAASIEIGKGGQGDWFGARVMVRLTVRQASKFHDSIQLLIQRSRVFLMASSDSLRFLTVLPPCISAFLCGLASHRETESLNATPKLRRAVTLSIVLPPQPSRPCF